MKTYTLTLIFILLGNLAFGQKTVVFQEDEKLLEEAHLLTDLIYIDLRLNKKINSKDTVNKQFAIETQEIILNKAIKYYQKLIDKFPKSCFVLEALESKGYAEMELNKNKEAKKTFQQIIGTNLEEKAGVVCENLTVEQCLSSKNRASKVLAGICIKEGNYYEALTFLDSTGKYLYSSFCGNGHVENDQEMTRLYAKCYFGLNETDRALKLLLPNLLVNEYASNFDIVELITEILWRKYTKEELKALFENAFRDYQTEFIKHENNTLSKVYFITFLGTKLTINSWKFDNMKPEELEKAIEKIYKTSTFYKQLTK